MVVGFLLFLPSVVAQAPAYTSLLNFYVNYSGFIDFFIYFIALAASIKMVMKKQWDDPNPAGRLVAFALCFALSLSFSLWEVKNNFSLLDIGVFAPLLILVLIIAGIIKVVRSGDHGSNPNQPNQKRNWVVWTIVLLFILIMLAYLLFPQYVSGVPRVFGQTSLSGVLGVLIGIILGAALIVLIVRLIMGRRWYVLLGVVGALLLLLGGWWLIPYAQWWWLLILLGVGSLIGLIVYFIRRPGGHQAANPNAAGGGNVNAPHLAGHPPGAAPPPAPPAGRRPRRSWWEGNANPFRWSSLEVEIEVDPPLHTFVVEDNPHVTLTAHVTGGSGNYSYFWDDGTGRFDRPTWWQRLRHGRFVATQRTLPMMTTRDWLRPHETESEVWIVVFVEDNARRGWRWTGKADVKFRVRTRGHVPPAPPGRARRAAAAGAGWWARRRANRAARRAAAFTVTVHANRGHPDPNEVDQAVYTVTTGGGESVEFSTEITGGSGNFEYRWGANGRMFTPPETQDFVDVPLEPMLGGRDIIRNRVVFVEVTDTHTHATSRGQYVLGIRRI